MTYEVEKTDEEWRAELAAGPLRGAAPSGHRGALHRLAAARRRRGRRSPAAAAASASSRAPRSSTRAAGGRASTPASPGTIIERPDRSLVRDAHRDPVLAVRRAPGPRLRRRADADRAALLRELPGHRLRRARGLDVEEAADRDRRADRTDHHAHDEHDRVRARAARCVSARTRCAAGTRCAARSRPASPRPNRAGPG